MGSLLFHVTALLTVLLAPGLSAQVLKRLSRAESEQLNEICGKTYIYGHPRGPVQRIAHGSAVHQGELPWAVNLIRFLRAGVGGCSGSIISKYHIITAAHCVMGSQTYLWFHQLKREYSSINIEASFLLAGSTCADPNIVPSVHEFWNSDGYEKPRKLRISKIIVPMSSARYEKDPKACVWRTVSQVRWSLQGISYVVLSNHPDIAILELEDPISDVGDRMVPICVPSNITSPPLEYTQYGFGLREDWMSFKKSCNMQLRKLRLNNGQLMERLQYGYKNPCEKMVVVHNPEGKPCEGDSGGGLSGMSYGKHYLFGLLHGTDDSVCGAPSNMLQIPYSIYTRVMPYVDFLCYHIGVCPLGYDVYMDKNYKQQPEGFFLFTKERQSIWVDEGNFGFLKRREGKNETLETSL